MDRMWAPWRKKYLLRAAREEEGCIFCNRLSCETSMDPENYIIHRGEFCFIILNKFPYNNCHLMIVPNRHLDRFEALTTEELAEMMHVLQLTIKALNNLVNPEGYNAGFNLGKVAGAGIHEHIHLHLVPRWNGDTNFMPVLGGSKIISESLEDSHRLIRQAFLEQLDL